MGFATMRSGEMKVLFYSDAASRAEATSVTVVDGETTSGIDQTVDTGASIAGTVTSTSGQAIAAARVTAYSQPQPGGPWQWWASTNADQSGSYIFRGLPARTYRLGFVDPNGTYASEYFDDAGSVQAAHDIATNGESRIVGKDAQLAPAARITGTVTGPDGAGVGNVWVHAYEKPAGQTWWGTAGTSVQTRADGTYDLGGLQAGTYRIDFTTFQTNFIAEFWNNAPTVETAQDVVVADGAVVAGRNAQLPPLPPSREVSPVLVVQLLPASACRRTGTPRPHKAGSPLGGRRRTTLATTTSAG